MKKLICSLLIATTIFSTGVFVTGACSPILAEESIENFKSLIEILVNDPEYLTEYATKCKIVLPESASSEEMTRYLMTEILLRDPELLVIFATKYKIILPITRSREEMARFLMGVLSKLIALEEI